MATKFFHRWAGLLLALGWAVAGVRAEGGPEAVNGAPLALTAEERAWVRLHPVVRVGLDPAWPPFSAFDAEGRGTGIDPDLLTRLGERLGLRFELTTRPTWPEVYAAAKAGEIDVLAGTAVTPQRAEDFAFTRGYLSFPIVIVTRDDEPLLWTVQDLVGRRLASVRGYVATEAMASQFRQLETVNASSVAQAMELVADGEADAFITNLPNASFVAKTRGLTNLKIAGVMPERFDLAYAVRPDWPVLRGLLDKAVAELTEADRQALVHPWIRVDYEKVIRWDLVWRTALGVLAVLGAVMAAVIYHNRCLARELKERIRLQREIKEAHDELVRLNEEKSELLQMAAHDLRGPLTGMQLVIDSSLRMKMVPSLDALGMVEKQLRQMTALLNDLLDVEALESGRRELRPEPLDPVGLLRAAVQTFGPMAENKQIQLDTAGIGAAVPRVRADAVALRQIADNLISNAIKFSPRGAMVGVALKPWNDFVRLEVADQGPGVPAEETERIFAKYARGSARPTAGEKSTGLGLSIVRQLASGMNGRVWCENRAEGGATFIVMVPVDREAPVAT